MGFDFSSVMKAMIFAAEGAFAQEWPQVKDVVGRVLADQKEDLELIASAYANGLITAGEFKEHLEGERDVFEAGVSMCRANSEGTVRRGADAALGVFAAAVKAGV
ncbi:hypothetical protein [Geobacter sp. SVR]|uniref:hypothetical protein n=1 Tax=Geobacter sp. SVR TaxID=2495594 RepID=UPI00143EF977|nr:hypothetical protein [Geobacter sp. SVR]BCS52018.1 hypothetical protein GSVR_03260 [Geobacter sp. SVR]GCF87168.1 hypothetical protein GSbR_37680 [Geobacter sp. SVR]